jgi:hypothetical protein
MKILPMLLVLVSLQCSAPAMASEPEKTIRIVATGIGISPDSARQNALGNAVAQVIGRLLTAETMVEKDRLLQEEILRTPGVFTDGERIVAEGRNADGLFSVKLEVPVAVERLKRRLELIHVFSGTATAGGGGGADVDRLLAKYPNSAYSYFIGKVEAEAKNPASGRTRASVPVTVKWDDRFLGELRDLLAKTAKSSLKDVDIMAFRGGANRDLAKDNAVICFSPKHPFLNIKARECFVFDQKDAAVAGKGAAPRWPGSILALLGEKKILTVSMNFKGKSGKLAESINYEFVGKDKVVAARKEAGRSPANVGFILRSGSFDPPNIIWRDPETNVLYFITEEVFSLIADVDIDANSAQQVADVEVSISNVTVNE